MKNNELPTVDPGRILESIVSELEMLCEDTAIGARSDLVQLHAALLVYELDGRVESIPNVGLSFSSRRLLEHRVTKAARRLIGSGSPTLDPDAAVALAAHRIEELLHLIDPDLRVMAA